MAAENLKNNILLFAPAGTGKTMALASRIAGIINNGHAEAEEILCLTFTNKACQEMAQRVAAIAGQDSCKVVIRSFHGFCHDIIKREARKHTDLSWDFTIFDEDECFEILDRLTGQDEMLPVKQLQYLVERLKNARLELDLFSADSLSDYKQSLEWLQDNKLNEILEMCNDKDRLNDYLADFFWTEGAKLAETYDAALKGQHALDFCDLISYAHRLFKVEAVRKYWAGRFKYINIDEVQDTSRVEYEIISQLFPGKRILLCGDFFQTIYEWRGSDPRWIADSFRRDYNPVEVSFQKNYRATKILLSASCSWLKWQFPDMTDKIYMADSEPASSQHGEMIQLRYARNRTAEAAWIYHRIKELGAADLSRICILTRNNYYNQKLSQDFENLIARDPGSEIRFMQVDQFKFFRRQEVKDVLAFLKLIVNGHDINSLKRIIGRFVRGVGKTTLETIMSESYACMGLRLTDFIDKLTHKYGEPYALLLEEIQRNNVVVFDVEATGLDVQNDDIIQLAAIRIDAKGRVVETFNKYLCTQKKVGSSEAIHHISDAKLAAEGEDPRIALAEFLEFSRGAVLAGHNVGFDVSITSNQLRRLGLGELEVLGVYDTLDIYRRFYPELKQHTLEYIGEYCQVSHKSSHDALDDILATSEILIQAIYKNIAPGQSRRLLYAGKHLRFFQNLMEHLQQYRTMANYLQPGELIVKIIMEMGIAEYYKTTDGLEDGEMKLALEETAKLRDKRVENLRQLVRIARSQTDSNAAAMDNLLAFIRLSALSNTDLDLVLQQKPAVPILTVHQAKGNEFDYVFFAGCQEGVFPSWKSIRQGRLEEEARLFYVAITRARKGLFISYGNGRRGTSPCHFLAGIPDSCLIKM